MKQFCDGQEHFALSAYLIRQVSAGTPGRDRKALSATLCEDACCLGPDASSQTAFELLRLANGHSGGEIRHILVLRSRNRSEQGCAVRHRAMLHGMLRLLRQAGYVTEELPYPEYCEAARAPEGARTWSVQKRDVQVPGVRGEYSFVPVVEAVDWEGVYSALQGSGCRLSVHVIPSFFSADEQRTIARACAQTAQAADGPSPALRDRLAEEPAERWRYFAQRLASPAAHVGIVVSGPPEQSALVTARVRRAMGAGCFTARPAGDALRFPVYSLPWRLAGAERASCIGRWTSEEAALALCFPVQEEYFTGVAVNPFSLVPELQPLPRGMLPDGGGAVPLGRSVYSGQTICLPPEAFLLHTAILGKTGTRKTTLLKQLIRRFSGDGVPVLVLEPVKREYRSLLAGDARTRVFTVESPVVPLQINPFQPPDGVALRDYRGSLLSAFKAAFSLPDPLPALFEAAVSEAYAQYGWTDASRASDPGVRKFDMADFVRVFRRVIARSAYSGEVKGNMMAGGAFRLQSLTERCPRTFGAVNSTPVSDLLSGTVIVEMGSLEPEQKSLVSALMLISLLAYLKTARHGERRLLGVILIDEAHALLDQGDGVTEEERALHGAMSQLFVNLLTEIRACGVGVIFADQTPSRIGGQILDSVDQLIAFRLSGEEAEMLRAHAGADENVRACLPLLSAGEFLFSNHLLRAPLAMRMFETPGGGDCARVTDEEIAAAHRAYLTARAGLYRPFTQCGAAACTACRAGLREEANALCSRIYAGRCAGITGAAELAGLIVCLPETLRAAGCTRTGAEFETLCRCTAVHLIRRCGADGRVALSESAVPAVIRSLDEALRSGGKGGKDHE